MNPGGIRADIVAGQISGGEAAGQVTYGELFTVQPFNNVMTVMTCTGAQIDALLEQQFRAAGNTHPAGPGGLHVHVERRGADRQQGRHRVDQDQRHADLGADALSRRDEQLPRDRR